MRKTLGLLIALMVSGCAAQTPHLPSAPSPQAKEGDLNSASVDSLQRLGDRLTQAGDARGAIRMYQRGLEKEPRNVGLLIRVGDALWASGAVQQAELYYDQALLTAPDNSEAMSRKARGLILLNEPEAALSLLDQVIKAGSTSAGTYASRGIALDLAGRPIDAQTAYAQALELEPDNIALRTNSAMSYALSKDYAASIEILRDLAGRPGTAAQAREALAMVYALSGQSDVAVELTTPPGEDPAIRGAFYSRLGDLSPREQAAAVYLRRLPPVAPSLEVETPVAAETPVPPVEESEHFGTPVLSDLGNSDAETSAIAANDAAEPTPEPVAEPIPEPVAEPVSPPTAERAYWVQVASFGDLADVAKTWKQLRAKHPALADRDPEVQLVTLGDGRTTYRLMIGKFPDRKAARADCAGLQAGGVDCVVTANDFAAMPLEAALAQP